MPNSAAKECIEKVTAVLSTSRLYDVYGYTDSRFPSSTMRQPHLFIMRAPLDVIMRCFPYFNFTDRILERVEKDSDKESGCQIWFYNQREERRAGHPGIVLFRCVEEIVVTPEVWEYARESFRGFVENLMDDPSDLLHPWRDLEPAEELARLRRFATDLDLNFDELTAKGTSSEREHLAQIESGAIKPPLRKPMGS